jgi:putative zinc finger protein
VNCLAVRPRLPEYSLASLTSRERASVERHIAVCAACRKESRELDEAASVLAFAAAPTGADDGLEDRVVDAVQAGTRKNARGHRRWRLAIAASIVAVVIALTGVRLGQLTAHPETVGDQASLTAVDRAQIAHLRVLLSKALGRDPGDEVLYAPLRPVGTETGTGWALVMLAPSGRDFVVLRVANMASDAGAPYDVLLRNQVGNEVLVGTMDSLDQRGSDQVVNRVHRDLTDYSLIVVLDRQGHKVLSGLAGSEPV